jgi:hypothetical protein
MDLLFTSLMMQMSAKLAPEVDVNLPLIENLVMLKEAGVKWEDIFRKLKNAGFYEDDVYWNPSKMNYQAKYVAYCKKNNRPPVKGHPGVYTRSFAEGFVDAVSSRLYRQREEQGQGKGGMEIALRDIRLVVRDAMFTIFPDLKPHEADCVCEACEQARKDAKKPIKYDTRQRDWRANGAGREAGKSAKIMVHQGHGLKGQGQLGS